MKNEHKFFLEVCMMKEKVIFLVDMQSFYASVEKAENPEVK